MSAIPPIATADNAECPKRADTVEKVPDWAKQNASLENSSARSQVANPDSEKCLTGK
jgi:hypothetical protein